MSSRTPWIMDKHRQTGFTGAFAGIDLLMINDSEIKVLTENQILAVARKIQRQASNVLSKGADGSMLLLRTLSLPCRLFRFWTLLIRQSAGDAFAGGFTGCLSKQNDCSSLFCAKQWLTEQPLRRSRWNHSASKNLQEIDMNMIEERVAQLKAMTDF